MKGIHPNRCIHHIYTNDQIRPIRKPQRRMNPTLKDIVKEEVQKLLHVNFIYPISDSKWVSPLVIVPKKNCKWRICVDFQDLTISWTLCLGRDIFLSWMGLVVTIKSKFHQNTRKKPHLPTHGGLVPIGFLLLVCVMPLLHFKGFSWPFYLI